MKNLSFCFICCLLFSILSVKGNNVKVNGTPELTLDGDMVNITFGLSWENSWRDEFNWDVAWIFVKYKLEGNTGAWNHLNLADSYEAPSDLTVNTGLTSSKVVGVFVYRNSKGAGDITNRQIKLKAPLSAFSGVTAANIENGTLYVAVSAVEMVYIPYGAYYLGDMASRNSFSPVEQNLYGIIPEAADVVDNNSGYVFTASSTYSNCYPSNAADHQNYSLYPTGSWYSNSPAANWWKVDFLTPKTIRYFGISGSTNYPSYAPTAVWYIEGSNDDVNWTTLSAVDHAVWRATATSYPVQQSIKVNFPGAYRYYRLSFPVNYYTMFQNVAMTEQELYPSDTEASVIVDNENSRIIAASNGNTPITTTVSANFPKGYNGFYMMKYELSQEQYVSFLNMLSYDQQKNRIGNSLDNLKRGDYAFGSSARPSLRNGICLFAKMAGKPAVFANNLNPAEPYYGEDDGQTLACNFLIPADMLAYCDWAGLRPMSELEYEKACRRPYPQKSIAGEYAWNQTTYNKITGSSDLVTAQIGTENETPQNLAKNVNVANPAFGPVRCGSFGASGSTQAQSGATYWGVMEMSGNVAELCYGIAATGFNGLDQANSYGDGTIDAAGASNVSATYWPVAATVANFALRGGSFASPDDNIRVSDRSVLSVSNMRDSTVGFRGVRGITGVVIDGGKISAPDTACWGGSWISSTTAGSCTGVSDVDFSYLWYVMKPGSSSYEIVSGQTMDSLWYEGFRNETAAPVSYSFKRVASCQVGVKESNIVTVKILNKPFTVESETVGVGKPIAQAWGQNNSVKWELEGAPSGSYVSAVGTNSVSVANVDLYESFNLKASLKQCPSDVFSKKVTVIALFAYSGAMDSVVLKPGKYKIECWGAPGSYSSTNKSYGAYTSGEFSTNTKITLYVYVGQSALPVAANTTSFNGGTGNQGGAPGGGASDVRLVGSPNWKDFNSLKSRLMVAAGGGSATTGKTGSGGGLSGYNGGGSTGGTQITYGNSQNTLYYTAGFGYGGGGAGGGGGYYGGGSADNISGSGGGSSFISGHIGCNAIAASSIVSSISHTGQPVHYSGIYFTNTVMIDGLGYNWTNALGAYVGMPALDGTGIISGNSGNGQVKITPIR